MEKLSFYMHLHKHVQVGPSVLARRQSYCIFSHNYVLSEILTYLDLFQTWLVLLLWLRVPFIVLWYFGLFVCCFFVVVLFVCCCFVLTFFVQQATSEILIEKEKQIAQAIILCSETGYWSRILCEVKIAAGLWDECHYKRCTYIPWVLIGLSYSSVLIHS